jgi:hypothetical protein
MTNGFGSDLESDGSAAKKKEKLRGVGKMLW